MAAFPEFPWTNISKLNQRLSVLEASLLSDQGGDLKKVGKAFEKIKETLKNDIKSIDVATLQRAEKVWASYLAKNPTDKKTESVFRRIAGPFQKTEAEKIQEAIEKDPSRREKIVKKKVKKWKKLSEDLLRQNMRSFIMSACRGEEGIPPCSLKDLFSTIENLSPEDSEIRLLLSSPNLFSSYEWKTGTYSGDPPNISDCIYTKLQSGNTKIQVDDHEVDEQLKKMDNERTFRLRNLETVYSKINEDPSQAVAGKFFERTSAWYIGSFLPKEPNSPHRPNAFEKEMREIGAAHEIVSITDSRDPLLIEQDQILSLDDLQHAAFPQDFVDFSVNEVRVPVMSMKRYPEEIEERFLMYFFREERKRRNPAWKQDLQHDGQKAMNLRAGDLQTIGRPWLKNLGRKSVRLALGLKATLVMNLTYNEGGNTLIGFSKDGSKFVIIGLDSYAFSKYLMEQELGRSLSPEEVTKAFAIDYGVKKEQIFFVEQPGDFHLDMSLAVIGEGTIAVNDAVMAKDRFTEDRKESRKKEETEGEKKADKIRELRAKGKKIFEDITATDLAQHGFKVIRVAGRFHYPDCPSPPKPYMNFFNMVAVTAPNGKKVVVSLGMDDKYKEEFKSMIQSSGEEEVAVHFIEPPDYYFLNDVESEACLELHGGVSCRSKIIPTPQN